jgi:hypothetical protein
LAEPNILFKTVSSIFDLSERAQKPRRPLRPRRRAAPAGLHLAAGAPKRASEPSGERRGGGDKSAETDGLASFSAPREIGR